MTEKTKKTSKYQSFSERFGDGEFYSELPKVPFKDLLGQTLVLHETKILADFKGKFGVHDAGLMLLSTADNEKEKFTTICSGVVVVERLKKAAADLPMICTPTEVEAGDGSTYYNLL